MSLQEDWNNQMETPHLNAEVQTLKDAFAALNRGDIAGFTACFDPRIERTEPLNFPGGGVYHGIDAVREHMTKARSRWTEGTCEPQRFVTAGDKIIVISQVHVRLKDETNWREGRVADLFVFKEGKVIEYHTCASEAEAMARAGIK